MSMLNYDKLKEIGKGSYGVVWLVKAKKEKKNFVLKRIDLRKSPERDKKSAQQEAQLLKNLKHPNIVSYKESFQADGFLNIVMLFCDGGDLYTKIKEQNGTFLEETQIVEWFVQIAMALQYMHEQNILHRDLKTQNIFLTKNKIIKVGDLGIARVLKSTNDMATTIIGTPYYMSPELFSNKPYNSKSDVWALGCCVYEMTTLKHAFNAKDMTSLVLKITRGKMPSIPQHYSRDLIVLIESMLNADPKKRPSVARILRDGFIKKNIMLFLERTKLKQIQAKQAESNNINNNSNNLKYDDRPLNNKQSNLQNSRDNSRDNSRSTSQDSHKIINRNSSNMNNISNNSYTSETDHCRPNSNNEQPNHSQKSPQKHSFSIQRLNHEQPKNQRPRVRISSVVENIETREYFKLESESTNDFVDASDNGFDSDNNNNYNKPYEVTQPLHRLKSKSDSEEYLPNKVAAASKPKIITRAENRAKDSPSPSSSVTNLNARERRRQKLRISQNESSSGDLKPPILRRLEAKPQKSEIFYNPDRKANDSASSKKKVSKSCNDIGSEKNRPLVDSLKIFRNINPVPGYQPKLPRFTEESNGMSISSKKEPNISVYHSSSSSSIASSNDDDPGAELIRQEKRKKRDIKEMDTFIGHLNATLNAENLLRCDSEIDDIKDEILEDLEEEAIQAESSFEQEDDHTETGNNSRKSKERDSYSYGNEDEESGSLSNRTIKNNHDFENMTISNLGATNHMHNRINQLEKEFISIIGPDKLREAFIILDSYKEDEVKERMTKLIGKNLYEANSGKLWLLKFCKDTAKISEHSRRRSSSSMSRRSTFQNMNELLDENIAAEEFMRIKKKLNITEHLMSFDELVASLSTDAKNGISQTLADKLLKSRGKNRVEIFDKFSYIDLVKDFFGGFAIFLWIGTFTFIFVYLYTYFTSEKNLGEYLTLGLFLAVFNVLNSYFSIYQNEKTNEMVTSFRKLMVQKTIVTREGQKYKIPSEKLVVGDLIDMSEGDIVPADIRIIKAFNLKIDNFHKRTNKSPEFKSTLKTSDDPFMTKNLAFRGNHVFEGSGQGLVIRTGEKTFYSHMAHRNHGAKMNKRKQSNLLKGVTDFMHKIKFIAVSIGLVYFLKSYLFGGYNVLQSTKFAIGLIIAQVPECLMITVSIVLGLAIKKLEKKNLLVKNIETIEKLGAVSIICSDKSGTLTQNKMRVKSIWYNDTFKNLEDFQLLSDVSLRKIIELHPILYDALLCNSVTFLSNRKHPSVRRECTGDPTDIAILQCIEELFGSLIDFQTLHPKVYEIPFNSVNKFQVSVHESAEGFRIIMKGAPELILKRCSTIYVDEKSKQMNAYWFKKSNQFVDQMTGSGHRVIGYCDLILDPEKYPKNFNFIINEVGVPNFPTDSGMRFLGLISMQDPLRPNTFQAVKKCRSAGIKVTMVTGDHPLTAESIAKSVGIMSKKHPVKHFGFYGNTVQSKRSAVVDGDYLKKMTEPELDDLLKTYKEIVFARTTPDQKEAIVKGYQRLDEFVCATGDGVNDEACLKKADIGIAMGITGTDICKEAADMILLDDNFATIQNAIEEGRLIYDNLKKSIAYTLATKIAVLTPFLMYVIADIPLPIGTIGILCIDFVDLIPPISLAFEKAESDLMRRPPISKDDRLVNAGMIAVTYGQIGMVEATAGYLMYTEIMISNGFLPSRLLGIRKSWDSEAVNDLQDSYGQEWTYEQRKDLEFRCNTGFFFAVLILQMSYLFICRRQVISNLKGNLFRNKMINLTIGLEIVLAIFFLYTPINESIHLHPMRLYRWVIFLFPFVFHLFAFDEVRKYIMRKYPDSWFSKDMKW